MELIDNEQALKTASQLYVAGQFVGVVVAVNDKEKTLLIRKAFKTIIDGDPAIGLTEKAVFITENDLNTIDAKLYSTEDKGLSFLRINEVDSRQLISEFLDM